MATCFIGCTKLLWMSQFCPVCELHSPGIYTKQCFTALFHMNSSVGLCTWINYIVWSRFSDGRGKKDWIRLYLKHIINIYSPAKKKCFTVVTAIARRTRYSSTQQWHYMSVSLCYQWTTKHVIIRFNASKIVWRLAACHQNFIKLYLVFSVTFD